MKTIKVSDETWAILFKKKINNRKDSLEEVIKDLIRGD